MQISTHFWGVIKSEGARAGGAEKGKPGMHGSPACPLVFFRPARGGGGLPVTPCAPLSRRAQRRSRAADAA